MTLEDFDRAKVIQHKLALIGENMNTLKRIVRSESYCKSPSSEYTFVLDGFKSERLIVDHYFIDRMLSYYSNQAQKLKTEFEALGKENNK